MTKFYDMRKDDIPENIIDLFDLIKKRQGFKNQQEMIEQLDMTRSFFFSVKKGEKHLSDENIARMCALASLPLGYGLVLNHLQKARSADCVDAYRKVLELIESDFFNK